MTGPSVRSAAEVDSIKIVHELVAKSLCNTTGQDREGTDEIRAIMEAMARLLAGVPLRSDGKLTIKSLADEAGLRRNKLTHKHTGLKDLFYALVKAQQFRPAIADELQRDNDELRNRLQRLREERDQLKHTVQEFARVVHVLEVENASLRSATPAGPAVRAITRLPALQE